MDLSQILLKKEAHCCLGQRVWPLILIYMGKKEKLRIGGKRVSGLNEWGIISHHFCPGQSFQRQY
jgi:hypothetical protein